MNSNRIKTFLFCAICAYFSNAQGQFKYFGTTKEAETSSIGLQLGTGIILGDVQGKPAYQGSIYYQYHFQRWLDGRISVGYGKYTGFDTKPNYAIAPNKLLNGTSDSTVNYTDIGKVYQNYSASIIDIGVQAKINLIHAFSKSYNGSFSIYALGGIGILSNVTKTDAKDGNGKIYPYNSITSTDAAAVTTQLNSMRDNTYESFADTDNGKNSYLMLTGGGGLRLRISAKSALGVEGLIKYTANDYLDGQALIDLNTSSKSTDIILNGGLFFEFLF